MAAFASGHDEYDLISSVKVKLVETEDVPSVRTIESVGVGAATRSFIRLPVVVRFRPRRVPVVEDFVPFIAEGLCELWYLFVSQGAD